MKKDVKQVESRKRKKFVCFMCKKEFFYEKSLINHVNEKCKVRKVIENIHYNEKNGTGYDLFVTVKEYKNQLTKNKITIDKYAKSQLFHFFEDLNKWLNEILPENDNIKNVKKKYVIYCLDKKINFRFWKKRNNIEKFMKIHYYKNNLEEELNYSLKFIKTFVEKTSNFKKGKIDKNIIEIYFDSPYYVILQHIISKKISPVVMFGTLEGKKFLQEQNEETLNLFKKQIGKFMFEKIKLKANFNKKIIEDHVSKFLGEIDE